MGAKCRVTTGKARGSFSVIRIYKQWVQTRCISSHGVVFVIVIVVLRGVGGVLMQNVPLPSWCSHRPVLLLTSLE